MRNISKYSQQTRNDLVSILSTDGELIAIALAKALTDKMVLPVSPVDNVEEFYKTNITSSNYDILIYIGEILPLNFEMVEDKIRIFWKLRYDLLHNSNYKLIVGKNALDFFGIGSVLSPLEIMTIEENSEYLCSIYNKFINIVKDIESIMIKERA